MTATAARRRAEIPVERVDVSAYEIPTEQQPHESDGTAIWSATTLVVVEVQAGGAVGTGWTYASEAAATFVKEKLAPKIREADALNTREIWRELTREVRNDGRAGLASYAISACDVALWDLRARLYDVALCDLFGLAHEELAIYGSGGFTSYDIPRLCEQLGGWAAMGIGAVKMKVGRDHAADVERVAAARGAIGPDLELFVDGNDGYSVAEAIAIAQRFHEQRVTWFEQPVDHTDLAGTRRVREHAPPGMAISSGEYITDTFEAARVAPVVDVLQADATRCGGYTGFLAIDGFCDVIRKPLSTHCGPMLHLHAAAASLRLRNMEWFHDHVRIERMLFDGFIEPVAGKLRPDRNRPGHGFTFKRADAQRFAV